METSNDIDIKQELQFLTVKEEILTDVYEQNNSADVKLFEANGFKVKGEPSASYNVVSVNIDDANELCSSNDFNSSMDKQIRIRSRTSFKRLNKQHEPSFSCDMTACKARFERNCDLRDHLMTHSVFKEVFDCDQCGACFSLSWNFKKHRKTHAKKSLGERFECSFCSRLFHKKQNLKRHLSVHQGLIQQPDNGLLDRPHFVTAPTLSKRASMCILDELRLRSFSSRSYNSKLEIIKNGRPTPSLDIKKTKPKKGLLSFQRQWYTKNPWLCGCQEQQKMFCWPCVLFSSDVASTTTSQEGWSKRGIDDIGNFTLLKERHTVSKDHIVCHSKFVKFCNTRIETTEAYKTAVQQHNDKVRNNRCIVSKLIDAVSYLARQEHGESSVSRENYSELLKLLAKSDAILRQHLDCSAGGPLSDVQNDLITPLRDVLINHINVELETVDYVAVVVNETTDITYKTQLSTVLRYVTSKGVQERFIGFLKSEDRSAQGVFALLEKIVEFFKCDTKLICQTYDGGSVISGCHGDLQKLVRDKYPSAVFVHCYAHKLSLVLQQAVSALKPCKVFFMTCAGLSAFLSKSITRSKVLEEIVHRRFPMITPTRWVYAARLIEVINGKQESLLELFDEMANVEWDIETKIMARGFKEQFTQLEFQFQFSVFSKILPKAKMLGLFNVLQRRINDNQFWRGKISDFIEEMQKMRDNFEVIWNDLSEYCEPNMRLDDATKISYKTLYCEIIEIIISHLNDRFGNLKELSFLPLLDPLQFRGYDDSFPIESFECLKALYKGFNFIKLKTELQIVYSDSDFRILQSVVSFHNYLRDRGLSEVFPEVFRLSKLILTIPATSVEGSLSALKRIRTYTRNTQIQEQKSHLSVLSIEKVLLDEISQSANFYDSVIDLFMKYKSRQIDLSFK